MDQILAGLNQQQRKAVARVAGPTLVIAGPGSGKTKALTHRIAYLISHGTPPQSILAVTFTNKAAREMQIRVDGLLSRDPTDRYAARGKPLICTFHSLGARILRTHAPYLGYTSSSVIYDEDDSLKTIKEVVTTLKKDPKTYSPKRIQHSISSFKNKLIGAELARAQAENPFSRTVAELYQVYQDALKERNAFDFDDLISKPIELFRAQPLILETYQRRFSFILVDEYQDTNHAQYVLLKLLAPPQNNVYAVGDMDQSIYKWRGADIRNVWQLEKDFENVQTILLEENYRSTKHIVETANAIIKKNTNRKQKTTWTSNGRGDPIVAKETWDQKQEGNFVTQEIHRRTQHKIPLSEIAVLYRTNAQSRALEEEFIQEHIPYKIIGSVRFYERKEIKDILAWLRLSLNEKDEISFNRLTSLKKVALAKNNKGRKRKVDLVREQANDFREKAASSSLTKLLKYVINQTGYEEYLRDGSEVGEGRWENVKELFTVTRKFDGEKNGLAEFLEEVALVTPADEGENKKDLVHLMTIHAAKGLEFNTVFITGCEDGLLPHISSLLDKEELEEERRLCYVAVTRAKEKLYFSFARNRTLFGKTEANPPSRFLLDIPEHIVEFTPAEEEYVDSIEVGL